jgi:polar amino acid transport system substrate-binding protein
MLFGRIIVAALCLALQAGGAGAQTASMEFAVSEWPPAEYSVAGEARGYHVDIVRAVLQSMGMSARFSFYPWKRAEMRVQRKEIPGLLSLHPTPEREALLLFAHEPLSSSDNVLFAAKGREFGASRLDSLIGKTIGVTAGYNYGDDFKRLSEQGLVKTDAATTDEQGMRKLVAGRFDAFVCDRVVGMGLVRSLGLQEQVQVLPLVVSSVNMHAAFARTPENAEFAQRFDVALRKLKKSGEWQRILDGYLK